MTASDQALAGLLTAIAVLLLACLVYVVCRAAANRRRRRARLRVPSDAVSLGYSAMWHPTTRKIDDTL